MTNEGRAKLQMAEYLERVPHVWFSYTPMHRPMAGRKRGRNEKLLLDITGYWGIEGRAIVFMVECKAPGEGVKADHQRALVNQVLRDGGFACFAESVDELRAKMRLFHPKGVP